MMSNFIEDKYQAFDNAFVAEHEPQHKYFERNRETGKIHTGDKIRNISYNTTGEILSYFSGGKLQHYNTKSKTTMYTSIKLDDYKYLTKHTLVFAKGQNMEYLSIYDNSILRDFNLNGKFVNMDVDTINDMVLGSTEGKTNIWDIRDKNPFISFESNNTHLSSLNNNVCVLASHDTIHTFDLRNYKKSNEFYVQPNWYKNIELLDNSDILMKTDSSYYFFNRDGDLKTFITLENTNSGAITPDGKNLLCCSRNYIFSYLIETRKKIDSLDLTRKENTNYHTVKVNGVGNQFVAAGDNHMVIVNWDGWRWYYGLPCYERFYAKDGNGHKNKN